MPRWGRWVAGIVGVTALIALGLAAALWLFVDRDGLRQLVVAVVKAQTGWDLVVEQPVALSLDGGIGVTLRALRLDGPASGQLRAEALQLRLRPWPLLARRLEVDALRLDGLVVDWQGPQRVDASAVLGYDPATQALVADPLQVVLDGTPVHGHARWQGGATGELIADLRADAIVIGGVRLSGLQWRGELKGGVFRQFAEGSLYGGSGRAVLDGQLAETQPTWSLHTTFEGVRLHELVRDLGRPGRVEGTATIATDLQWQGSVEPDVRRTLRGTARLALRDGALIGIDLPHLIRKAGSLLDGKPGPEADRGRTAFAAVDATAVIENGVLRNDDLRGEAPPFQLAGRGTVDLVADRLDYLLTATLPAAATDLGKRLKALRGVPIPVRLTGPLADPTVGLDLEAALQGAARLRLERKLDERLDGKLGDKLRSLLGR